MSDMDSHIAAGGTDELREYSRGLSHAYKAVFAAIYEAQTVDDIRARIQKQWEQIIVMQKSKGVL